MMRSVTTGVLAAAAILVAAALPATARAAATDPLGLVQQKYEEIQAVVKANPQKEPMQAAIRKVMDTFVDYTELSKRTLSDQWGKLKKKEQDEFVGEFKRMIQRTYVKRFDPDKEVRIEYVDAVKVAQDGTAVVQSTVKSGKSEAKVDYKLVKRGAQWWAFDVVIDDVSMIQNYRKQFHDIMAKDGYAGLIAKLKKKNATATE